MRINTIIKFISRRYYTSTRMDIGSTAPNAGKPSAEGFSERNEYYINSLFLIPNAERGATGINHYVT